MKSLNIKHIIASSCICFNLNIGLNHAGTAGPTAPEKVIMPYASLEGSYTWNSIKDSSHNGNVAHFNREGWGGRFAVGMLHPFREKIDLGYEVGGGYYGYLKGAVTNNERSGQSNIDGYDFLAEAYYHSMNIDWFGGVGFMAQNHRVKLKTNLSTGIEGNVYSGQRINDHNLTQILPEIKVGALYTIQNNWKLSIAYLYVFGQNTSLNENFYANDSSGVVSFQDNSALHTQNPSLSTIFLGLRYTFV